VDQLREQVHVTTWQLVAEQAAAVGKDKQLAAAEAAAAEMQRQHTSELAAAAAAAADMKRQLTSKLLFQKSAASYRELQVVCRASSDVTAATFGVQKLQNDLRKVRCLGMYLLVVESPRTGGCQRTAYAGQGESACFIQLYCSERFHSNTCVCRTQAACAAQDCTLPWELCTDLLSRSTPTRFLQLAGSMQRKPGIPVPIHCCSLLTLWCHTHLADPLVPHTSCAACRHG
jgi:hypothetical protein